MVVNNYGKYIVNKKVWIRNKIDIRQILNVRIAWKEGKENYI